MGIKYLYVFMYKSIFILGFQYNEPLIIFILYIRNINNINIEYQIEYMNI